MAVKLIITHAYSRKMGGGKKNKNVPDRRCSLIQYNKDGIVARKNVFRLLPEAAVFTFLLTTGGKQ